MDVRVSAARFRAMAEAELAAIPDELRALLVNVAIEVKNEPGSEADDMEDDLLGLYCGPERADFLGSTAHGQLPAKVYLYQWNLEDSVESLEELQNEIRLTLRHELSHHFGFNDDDLERIWPEGA